MTRYLVRQSRPAYFSGFENEVFRNIEYDKITEVPFCKNFKHDDFEKFTVEPYGTGDELIIMAHYKNGKSWVVAFALPMDSNMMSNNNDLMRDNWRYRNHTS